MYTSYICNHFICVFNLIPMRISIFFLFFFGGSYYLISPLCLRHLSNLYYLNNFACPEMDHGKDVPLIYREAVNPVHCLS